MLGTFDLADCFYLVTLISTSDATSCVFWWYFYRQQHLLYMVKVFILLIPCLKMWYVRFACIVIVVANHHGSKLQKIYLIDNPNNATILWAFLLILILNQSYHQTHSWRATIRFLYPFFLSLISAVFSLLHNAWWTFWDKWKDF